MPLPLKQTGAEPWTPEPYQLQGAQFLLENAASGLLLPPGLRKTSIVLASYSILLREKIASRALVIAPLRVCYSVWPKEIKKWKDFEHLRVEILHGKNKEEALRRDADIYLINFEGLAWLFGIKKELKVVRQRDGSETTKRMITYDLERFKILNADTLIIDEISKMRNHQSDRFQIIKPLLTKFSRRWGMTGSPAPKGLLNLFGIAYLLDLGRALGQYISHYRAAYFMQTGYGGFTWVPQPGAEEKILERLSPLMFRLSDEHYLKLPEIIENPIMLELPEKVRKLYDELEEEFITQFDGKIITAANAGVATTKLAQIANGGLFLPREVDDEGRPLGPRKWENLHDVKTEAVMDLLDELNGTPALVVYDFEHDLDRLKTAIGKDTPHIGGGVTPKQSDKILEAWNRNELPALLGHPAAMGHGLNGQEGNACHIIWHSITWDWELFDQLVRRLRRSGNKAKHIFLHFLIMRDTVDEAKIKALRRKEAGETQILEVFEEYTTQRAKRLGIQLKGRHSKSGTRKKIALLF